MLFAAVPAVAMDNCKARIDKKNGVILVSAANVAGAVSWGGTEGSETGAFFNAATCVAGTSAKKCQLADPATLAAKTPPDGCTLYLGDGTTPCSAWITGRVPGSRGATCGDGNAEGAEECDGLDVKGQSCESEGFEYGGTLSCTACGLVTTECRADRFEDTGSTIIDWQTKLEWEKKTGTLGAGSVCPGGANCYDPHSVNNLYDLGATSPYFDDDGSVFFSFLAALNDGSFPFNGHDDWRLPTATELFSIVDPFQSPAIDPIFGPTMGDRHWVSNAVFESQHHGVAIDFSYPIATLNLRYSNLAVRAVRSID